MNDNFTFYYDESGTRIGSDNFLLTVTLHKGMEFEIQEGDFRTVVDWSYHKDTNEESGLRIVLSNAT